MGKTSSWRWGNVPLPEAHLVGLGAGTQAGEERAPFLPPRLRKARRQLARSGHPQQLAVARSDGVQMSLRLKHVGLLSLSTGR